MLIKAGADVNSYHTTEVLINICYLDLLSLGTPRERCSADDASITSGNKLNTFIRVECTKCDIDELLQTWTLADVLGMLCALQGYFTPLMWASKHGHTAVVHALIGAGARLNVGSMVSLWERCGRIADAVVTVQQ
jgi:hypothetical protein